MAGQYELEMPKCYVDMDAAEIEYTGGGAQNVIFNIMLVAGIVTLFQAFTIVPPGYAAMDAVAKETAMAAIRPITKKFYIQAGALIVTGAGLGAQTGKIGLGNLYAYDKDA